jgi:threonine/homoserine/homoserine lactone efflux protein
MTSSIWLTLLAAAILISLSPGAGAVTAMSYGLSQGVRHWLRNARARRAQNRITGCALIGAGLILSGAQH